MTTALTLLTFILFFAHYLTRVIKRVVVKPVAKSGLIGPELLAEKTRLDVWREWLRPMGWGVIVGAVMWPVIGWIID